MHRPSPPTLAECGINAAAVDFSNPTVSLVMLDAEGATTNWPFPGGSVRWTNVGTQEGQAFDLLVTEQEGSTRTYTQPGSSTSAAALSGGFACLNVGVAATTCTNSGTYDSSWTPAQATTEACSAGEVSTAGTCTRPPLAPPPLCLIVRVSMLASSGMG